jgi:hypothetical protein
MVHISCYFFQYRDVVEVDVVSSFDTMFHHSRLFWLAKTCLLRSLHQVSVVLPVCPTYTSPHSQGMWYILGTFRLGLIWLCA